MHFTRNLKTDYNVIFLLTALLYDTNPDCCSSTVVAELTETCWVLSLSGITQKDWHSLEFWFFLSRISIFKLALVNCSCRDLFKSRNSAIWLFRSISIICMLIWAVGWANTIPVAGHTIGVEMYGNKFWGGNVTIGIENISLHLSAPEWIIDIFMSVTLFSSEFCGRIDSEWFKRKLMLVVKDYILVMKCTF